MQKGEVILQAIREAYAQLAPLLTVAVRPLSMQEIVSRATKASDAVEMAGLFLAERLAAEKQAGAARGRM